MKWSMALNTGVLTSWTLNHSRLLSPKNLALDTGERMASTSRCASNGQLLSTANVTSARCPLSSRTLRNRVMSGGGGAATKQYLVGADSTLRTRKAQRIRSRSSLT